jgi:histidyl-tRNA synthetase
MLLAAGERPQERAATVFIAFADRGRELADRAFLLARDLRAEGYRVESEQAGRSMKGQLKQADRLGAFATVILGESTEVKDMESGEQRAAEATAQVLDLLRETAHR